MTGTEILLRVRDYDLAATLDSGQPSAGNPAMIPGLASSANVGCA